MNSCLDLFPCLEAKQGRKQLSTGRSTGAILGFQFGLYRVVITCLDHYYQVPRERCSTYQQNNEKYTLLRTFALIAILRVSSAHAIHWPRACHIIFKRTHRVKNSTKCRADDLCVNLVCEYFCWMVGDPTSFSADHFVF